MMAGSLEMRTKGPRIRHVMEAGAPYETIQVERGEMGLVHFKGQPAI